MFRRDIRLRSSQDAVRELARTREALDRATLPEVTRALLWEQLESTLTQFQAQLAGPHTQSLIADRVMEGDGYRVTIEVRLYRGGLIAKLMRLLRGG